MAIETLPGLEGRYRVIRLLGGGGMGEVYLAEHTHLRRLDAIKVLRSAVRNEFASRFRREARAMNRLRHPNIVALYDCGQLADGRCYMSMEYAEGATLAQLLREDGKLAIDRAVALMLQVAGAIGHAHSQGVIHRDLKPANMIVTRRNDAETVRVLDFGLAKIVACNYDDSVVRTDGTMLGTPAYVAPEILRGQFDDPRSDLYSLGCVAFEVLSGRTPFLGKGLWLCEQHLAAQPPRLAEVTGGLIPGPIADVVDWCLVKAPELRPNCADDVIDALRAARRVAATPVSTNVVTLRSGPPTLEHASPHGSGTVVPPDPTPVADPRAEIEQGLRRLAELLVDHGSTDARLLLALARAYRVDLDTARAREELAVVRIERAHAEQALREREASLRFSVGDITQARERGNYAAAELADLDEAIASLTTQLARVEREADTQFRQLDDREIAIVARHSNLFDERERIYADLENALAPLVADRRGEDAEIAALAADVEAVRARRASPTS